MRLGGLREVGSHSTPDSTGIHPQGRRWGSFTQACLPVAQPTGTPVVLSYPEQQQEGSVGT